MARIFQHHADVRECSTPFGICDEDIGGGDEFPNDGRTCSTPFGICDEDIP